MPDKQLTLRLPEDLHKQVVEIARDDMRSLNAEIVVLLREAIAAREAAKEKSGSR